MGCCGSKSESPEQTRKPYSWEIREKIDPKDFTVENVIGGSVVKEPGSINGEPFIIKDCKDSKIYLLDAIATITIDDCSNCQFVIGPTRGSLFLRDCHDCKVIVACQQFRTRDCSKIDTFLLCSTQPIIESSCKMKFACYQLAYDGLLKQFSDSSLSIFNNNWYNIHDFTPVPESKNWTLLADDVTASNLIDLQLTKPKGNGDGNASDDMLGEKPHVALHCNDSVIPLTRGSRENTHSESCLMLFFHNNNSTQVAIKTIASLKGKAQLVQTKEISLSPDDAKRIISEKDLIENWKNVQDGPVIGLEFMGDQCVEVCRSVVGELGAGEVTIYVSPNSDAAKKEVESFYNFCDMQMSV